MVRADINEKIQHEWLKIYQYGYFQKSVRGLCCEEYLKGYGTEHFFYSKATIIGYREVSLETCEEDMNARVRHWALYFNSRETTEMAQPPKLYTNVEEGKGNFGKEGNNISCRPYYKHYYVDIGSLVGIFDSKKKAKQVGEKLLNQRRLRVLERLEVVNKSPDKGISSDDMDLPFE